MLEKKKKISGRKDLIRHLKNSISIETSAKNSYENDMKIIHDDFLVNEIKKIRDDEERHIVVLKNLIDMLEKNS
jgi:rubrerythrin